MDMIDVTVNNMFSRVMRSQCRSPEKCHERLRELAQYLSVPLGAFDSVPSPGWTVALGANSSGGVRNCALTACHEQSLPLG